MQDYLVQLTICLVPLWAIVQVIGRIFPNLDKAIIAIVIGVIGAIVAHGTGLLVAPGLPPWAWIMAAFGGLLVGAGSGTINDRVAKPVAAAVKKTP